MQVDSVFRDTQDIRNTGNRVFDFEDTLCMTAADDFLVFQRWLNVRILFDLGAHLFNDTCQKIFNIVCKGLRKLCIRILRIISEVTYDLIEWRIQIKVDAQQPDDRQPRCKELRQALRRFLL